MIGRFCLLAAIFTKSSSQGERFVTKQRALPVLKPRDRLKAASHLFYPGFGYIRLSVPLQRPRRDAGTKLSTLNTLKGSNS